MLDLKEAYEAADCTHVTTYLQSGNVVFQYPESDPIVVANQIEKRIEARFGFHVPVLIISASSLQAVYDANPYLNTPHVDKESLYITMLYARPEGDKLAKIQGYTSGNDSFSIHGTSIYVYCPDGYGRIKLNNSFFEQKLKVTATTRNLRTVTELIRMANDTPTP